MVLVGKFIISMPVGSDRRTRFCDWCKENCNGIGYMPCIAGRCGTRIGCNICRKKYEWDNWIICPDCQKNLFGRLLIVGVDK